MNIEQICNKVQRHYNCVEFTNEVKAIGLKELRKQQYSKGLNTLALYIDSLYRRYQYSVQ